MICRALMQSKVSMLATSFKDMFDFLYSVEQAEKSGVRVCVSDETLPGGYVFLPREASGTRLPEGKTAHTSYAVPEPYPGRETDSGSRYIGRCSYLRKKTGKARGLFSSGGECKD